MARAFVAASSQYAKTGSAIITAAPATYSAWVNLASAPTAGNLMYVVTNQNNTGGNDISIRIFNDASITRVEAVYYGGAGNQLERGIAFTPSLGTWFHVAAVFTSNTAIQAFYNGTGDDGTYHDTSVGTPVPAGLNDTMLGALDFNGGVPTFGFLDGSLAHVAIWNTALTQAAITLLAAGLSPGSVNRSSLVSYVKLQGSSPETDDKSATSYSLSNGPAYAADPTSIYYNWIPTADVSAGSWAPSSGGSLYPMLDEEPPDDSDYITSSLSPSADTARIKFVATQPVNRDGHIVNYRMDTGGCTTVVVNFYCATTLIKSWTHSSVPAGINTYAQTLSNGEATSITDYTDLELEFIATA